MSGEIISPYPKSLVTAVINSPLFKTAESEIYEAWRLFAVLETLPYNSPVVRHGHTYHLICDAHGGVILTQDGVVLGGSNLSENIDAAHA